MNPFPHAALKKKLGIAIPTGENLPLKKKTMGTINPYCLTKTNCKRKIIHKTNKTYSIDNVRIKRDSIRKNK